MYQTSFEICPHCNSLITDEEFVVNWGGCGKCLDASYEGYLGEQYLASRNLVLDLDPDFDYNGS